MTSRLDTLSAQVSNKLVEDVGRVAAHIELLSQYRFWAIYLRRPAPSTLALPSRRAVLRAALSLRSSAGKSAAARRMTGGRFWPLGPSSFVRATVINPLSCRASSRPTICFVEAFRLQAHFQVLDRVTFT
jgi:hypothetical protein